VAVSVGTIGNRASSWLSRTSSPAAALFQVRDLLPCRLLLGRVAAEEPVRRPVRADAVLRSERLQCRLADPHAAGLEQVLGQFGVRPVGPVQAVFGRPVDHPLPQDRGQVRRQFGFRPARLPRPQSVDAAVEVGVQPSLHRPGGGAGVGGDVRVPAAPVGHQNDLHPVSQLGVGGRAEYLVQADNFGIGQGDADHGPVLGGAEIFPTTE
jgi:hypothetical protein